MYSKEDRERILADLEESGMPLATFARRPGSPSRASLSAWRRQAEAGGLDVPAREVRGRAAHDRHARYPEATRREAVSLVRRGMRPADAARRLGVSSGDVVSSWLKAAERGMMAPKEAMPMDGKARGDRPTRAELEARLAEAEGLLAESEMDRRVLQELMRDPKAGGLGSLSNRQKTELGEKLRQAYGYSLRQVLRCLSISKSTYEYNRRAIARDAEAARAEAEAWEAAGEAPRGINERVREAFEASGRTYGYRRVHAQLRREEEELGLPRASEREVRDAMREGGMRARRTAKARRGGAGAGADRPANALLNDDGTHDFHAAAPDLMVATDTSEFAGAGGAKAYLAPILDLYDGKPASWSITRHPDAESCVRPLLAYLGGLPAGHGPVGAHSDGGSPFTSDAWIGACEANGVSRSMSRPGRCQDNARVEGFFGIVKEEFYNGRDWSSVPIETLMAELDAYMRWYQNDRLKGFKEDGRTVYYTIPEWRKRQGHAL